MNILDFISHIKHNSLSLEIRGMKDKLLYSGDVGSYKHSVAKQKLDKKTIVCVIPEDNLLSIVVEGN